MIKIAFFNSTATACTVIETRPGQSLMRAATQAGIDGIAADCGGSLTCATCHVGGNNTDNNSGRLHAPSETGMDPAYAMRTANKAYRTTPLRGLWQHPPYLLC